MNSKAEEVMNAGMIVSHGGARADLRTDVRFLRVDQPGEGLLVEESAVPEELIENHLNEVIENA